MVAFLVVGVLYLALFGGLNHRAGKRGRELLPHRSFWSELLALVQDGVRFSRTKVSNGSPARPSRAEPQSDSERTVGKEKAKRKEKKRTPSRTASATKSSTSHGEDGVESPLLTHGALATADLGDTSGGGTLSTASGSGGRWVHVPE